LKESRREFFNGKKPGKVLYVAGKKEMVLFWQTKNTAIGSTLLKLKL